MESTQPAGRPAGLAITRELITFAGDDCDSGDGLYFLFDIDIGGRPYRVRAGVVYTRDVGDITGQKMIRVPHDLAASMYSNNRVVIDFADIPYDDFPMGGGGRVEREIGRPLLTHPLWSNDPSVFVPARRGDLAILLTGALRSCLDADGFADAAVRGYEMIYRAFGKPVPPACLCWPRN